MAFKLLNTQNAKTPKGESKGILSGVLYLAPHNLSGFQVCPKASEGCKLACLYTAGRGVYTKVQNSRIAKTKRFFLNREKFMSDLVWDIEALIRKAKRMNLTPAVRLNGTSDIAWEKIKCIRNGVEYASLMEAFSEVTHYEYTKIVNRKKALSLPNYHLTFSMSEDNEADALEWLKAGGNVAVVMNTKRKQAKPATFMGFPVINGDETDARFLDDVGHIIALTAKGKARFDKSGFVKEWNTP